MLSSFRQKSRKNLKTWWIQLKQRSYTSLKNNFRICPGHSVLWFSADVPNFPCSWFQGSWSDKIANKAKMTKVLKIVKPLTLSTLSSTSATFLIRDPPAQSTDDSTKAIRPSIEMFQVSFWLFGRHSLHQYFGIRRRSSSHAIMDL